MRIQEFQAKKILIERGLLEEKGVVVTHSDGIDESLAIFPPDGELVVKAQVLAGGRGQGHFLRANFQGGGVQRVKNRQEAVDLVRAMLGNFLVTKQTDERGKLVSAVYVCETLPVVKEYYLAILADRTKQKPLIIIARDGGVEIEALAESNAAAIQREYVLPAFGLQPFQLRKIGHFLGFKGRAELSAFSQLLQGLYDTFWELDCSLLEVNPLAQLADGSLVPLDLKLEFDDNGLFRHPELVALRDPFDDDPREARAREFGLSYVALDGNIGCLVNGAGLAMATMDVISHCGGRPANFLDVAGNSTDRQIQEALRLLLMDDQVERILINIFGGISCGDQVAAGILRAIEQCGGLNKPLLVRLEGTRAEEGRRMLIESGLPIRLATSLMAAAQAICSPDMEKLPQTEKTSCGADISADAVEATIGKPLESTTNVNMNL